MKEPGDLKQPGDGSSELGVGEDISKETCSVIQTRQAIKFFLILPYLITSIFKQPGVGSWEFGVGERLKNPEYRFFRQKAQSG